MVPLHPLGAKNSSPMKEDPKLREVLGAWQVSPPLAPGFKASVWRRIAAEEERVAAGFWAKMRKWFFVQLPRPAYASAVLAVTVLVGITVANVHASHMREEYRLKHARQYLASIDPIAMSAASSRASR
jgi:hypothetical protein